MWRILKAEISYNRLIMIIPAGLVLAAIIANIVEDWRNPRVDLPGVKTIMAVALALITGFSLIKFIKEKRERFLAVLPLPILKIGISRLLFAISIWVVFILLFFGASLSLISLYRDNILWDTLSLTGFVLLANAFVFIYRDLNLNFREMYQRWLILVFYSVGIMLGYLVWYLYFTVPLTYFDFIEPLNRVKEGLPQVSSKAIGAFVFNLIGIALTMLSVFIFKHRKTYLG